MANKHKSTQHRPTWPHLHGSSGSSGVCWRNWDRSTVTPCLLGTWTVCCGCQPTQGWGTRTIAVLQHIITRCTSWIQAGYKSRRRPLTSSWNPIPVLFSNCVISLGEIAIWLIVILLLCPLKQQLYLATGGDPVTDENTALNTTGPTQPPSSLSLAEPVACAGNSGPILCSDAGSPQVEQLCVVCHYFPLSRALLPCRHTCICAVCFCKYLTSKAGECPLTNCCSMSP